MATAISPDAKNVHVSRVQLKPSPRYAPGDRVILIDILNSGSVRAVSLSPSQDLLEKLGPGDQYVVSFDNGELGCVHEDVLRPENSKVTAFHLRHQLQAIKKSGGALPNELVVALRVAFTLPTHTSPSARSITLVSVKKEVKRTIARVLTSVATLSIAPCAPPTIKCCSRAKCPNPSHKRGLCKSHFSAYRKKNAFN